jgi:hypothetical protein
LIPCATEASLDVEDVGVAVRRCLAFSRFSAARRAWEGGRLEAEALLAAAAPEVKGILWGMERERDARCYLLGLGLANKIERDEKKM